MTSHQSSEDLLQPGHIVKVISFVTFCALLLPAWPSCFIQFPHTFFYAFILSSNILYFFYVTTYFLLFFLLSFYFLLLLSVSFCLHLFPPDSSVSSFFLLFFMLSPACICFLLPSVSSHLHLFLLLSSVSSCHLLLPFLAVFMFTSAFFC